MTESLKTRAYNHIRGALMEGRWPEGTFISPAKLAKQIGISYTPVREAVIQLASEGLVEQIPKLGVCTRRLTRQEMEQLFDLREILEAGAARRAAERITPSQLADMENLCRQHGIILHELRDAARDQNDLPVVEKIWTGPRVEKLAKLNVIFHLGLMGASQNPPLMKTVSDLHILTRVLRDRVLLPGETYLHRLARDYRFHVEILRALRRRDGQAAAEWTERHVVEARRYHLAVYDWREEQNRTGDTVSLQGQDWPRELLDVVSHMEDLAGNKKLTN